MATFSPPYKLFLLTDPGSGKRRQLRDKSEADREAFLISQRTGAPIAEILKTSRHYYTDRYLGNRNSKRVNTGASIRQDAERWIEDRTAKARQGIGEPRKQEFAEAVDLWLSEKEMSRRSSATMYANRSIAGMWKEHFGSILVSEVQADDVTKYFGKREAGKLGGSNNDTKKKPMPRTLMKDRGLLKGFFTWARQRGLCSGNPAEFAPTWRPAFDEPESLTAKEAAKLLETCRKPYKLALKREKWRPYESEQEFLPPPHLYGVVLTALHTLLRLGNILSLTWDDVDTKKGVIQIGGTKTKTRQGLRIQMTPTLKAHFDTLDRGAPAAPVFGVPLTTIKTAFNSSAKRAGLKGLKFHTLRKTGATILLNAGVPIKTVQSMGGWKNPDVLLRHYAAVTVEQRDRAVQVLDKLGG